MRNEDPVFRSLELIENRISEKLTVENIASSVYFSKYHYQRIFREIVGDSVMEYVMKRKLTLAGAALLETDAHIIDIALEYGYDSREGFTRSFKAYMGVSPVEYRKYGLSAISQKIVKERLIMTYSKTTDEIIRELNNFIAKAKETAQCARKNEVSAYIPFWNTIADASDAFADKAKEVSKRITAISEDPDQIASRFAIIKVIEDIAFQSNLLAFNVGLMVSRGQPEDVSAQWPLCEKYRELARAATLKAEKIAGFFNELSSLIFEDMRKSAAEKMQKVVQTGKAAADDITGYDYIKGEVANLVSGLSVPLERITVSLLEDYLFRLNIILFSADMDIFRNPKDKSQFDGMKKLQEVLAETIEFFQTLVKPEATPVLERTTQKHFQDISYQGSILLFYTRGEVEKLWRLLDEEQKAAFNAICDKVNDFIQFIHSANGEQDYKPAADKLYSIHSDMIAEADQLKDRGGAVRFLAGEFKGLADAVMRCVKE